MSFNIFNCCIIDVISVLSAVLFMVQKSWKRALGCLNLGCLPPAITRAINSLLFVATSTPPGHRNVTSPRAVPAVPVVPLLESKTVKTPLTEDWMLRSLLVSSWDRTVTISPRHYFTTILTLHIECLAKLISTLCHCGQAKRRNDIAPLR